MHLNDESTTTCLDNNKKSTDSQTTINSNNNNSGHSDDQLIVNKSLTVSIDDGSQQNPTNLPINPNDISIMQDSTDLHWFNEETYQSEKTHLIENMPIISESSTNTESINRTTGGNHYHQNRYHVLSRNIDATLAEIDMETFTSEDINHIYSTLPELDSSCSADDGGGGDGTVTEDGGEEFASVTGSLLDEIHSDSHYLSSKRFNSRGIDLNGSSSIFDSSLIVDESSVKTLSSGGCGGGDGTLTMRSERFPGLYERSHLDVSGVSADSLDFSSSENDNNTNEMILRCREQDKTKYTIAFEESVSSVTTFSDSADDIKNNSEESDTVTHFNHHHHHHNRHHHYNNSNTNKCNHQQRRRRMNGVNFISVNNNTDDGDDDDYDLEDDYHRHDNDDNDLVKSEYTTWNMVKRRGPISRRELIRLRRYPFRTIAKQSQSLPNIVQVTSILTGDHGEPLFPPLGSYVPLYDLNKSNTTTNSSNSEVSPPRSLIRLFIKNRTSPTSSSPGSSSTSFEGHLIESSELNHGNHHHHHHHHQGQQSTLSGGGSGGLGKGFTRSGGGPNGQYYFGDKEGNLKVAFNDKRNVGQQCVNEDWNNFEDSLMGEGVTGNGTDAVGGHVTLLPPKNGFNRLKQASPIREEDITSDTSRGDEAVNSGTDESYHGKDGKLTDRHWPIYHFDKFKSNTNNGNNNNDRVNVIGARRSISVDRFMSTQCTGGSGCGGGGGDTDGIGIRGGGPSSTGGGTSNNPNSNIRRSSDYGSTNMNKIRFSSGREFGSVSSGYLSSRQGSSEWHRKTAFTHHPPSFQHQQQPKPSSSSSSLPHQYPLNPSSSSSSIPSKRYSISVTTMRTASTQVPVHIQDKQVQTGINCQLGGGNGGDNEHEQSTDPSMGFIVREYPTSTVREKSIPLSSCYAKETFSPSSDYHNYRQNHEPQDESQRAKPLYVCFPNYSLPDLSFLRTLSCPCTPKEEGPSAVYLSPTKLKLPLREFKSNGGNVGGIRRPFGRGKGVRPKSCTDYENLIANRSFNHIKDWDSLKVLLPNEFKSLIARLEGGNGDSNQPEESKINQDGGSRKSKESDVNFDKRTSEKSTTINNTNPFSSNYKEPKTMTSPSSEVKLRPRKRSVRTLDGYQGPSEVNEGACGCHQERKRHSLQEPPSDYGHHHNHHPPHYHHPSNFHHHETNEPINCTYRNTISRSVTMPSCVCNSQQPVCHLNCCQPPNYYQQNHFHPHDHHLYSQQQQQQQQHNPHHVHHVTQNSPVTGINSCCQGVTGIGGGAGKSSMSSNVKPNEINSSLVNGLFDDPSVDRLCHLLSKGISVKDFTNIIGGVGTPGNTMNSGGNGIGINHKNRLPSPSKPYEPIKEQVIEETDSMCISSKGGGDTNHLAGLNNQHQQLNINNDNNRITKGEDESKINSNFNVIKKRWESLASPVSSTINSPEPNLPIITNTGKGKSSPTPPRSTTPPTPSSNYSSPAPSSSSTTTSSSALLVKPKVPIKPPLSSLRPTSVPIAKRPTTLGANNSGNVFKSMIPIAKGSKSPPNVKQLTSPISKTLPRTNCKKSSATNKTT
ncbi:homeobox protein 5-like isoform X2 [Panonychus citri]|uniref:homeobox protein 5-like isoform X2 n=1 Tax=Panonychus citri TaxID=50023 RepID=UPI0023070803|nr:homeobox protein 5-like isoform X2 [Panonychus citri]